MVSSTFQRRRVASALTCSCATQAATFGCGSATCRKQRSKRCALAPKKRTTGLLNPPISRSEGKATAMKLYRIQTIAPEFQDRQNVSFDWFVSYRAVPALRDASKLVESYSR